MNEFDLNAQYRLYLQRVGLNELTMSKGQRRELKRAFMGACAQMLMLFRDGVLDNGEIKEPGMDALGDMITQTAGFWTAEIIMAKKEKEKKG